MNAAPATSLMYQEVRSVPELTQRLLSQGRNQIQLVAEHLQALNPRMITTVARGSSDHAASFLKYAIELSCGIPVSSTGPSISSVYEAKLKLPQAATIAISQSGKSPDIVSMARAAKLGGSQLIALTNNKNSPLSEIADCNIDILAGPELSVAATKTFILSIVSGLLLIALWKQDSKLLKALESLPQEFENALSCDWSPLSEQICRATKDEESLYVLGRGPSFSIAKECALKFKETCQLHAEAYSTAEVMHGPVSIAHKGFPTLVLASRDAAEKGVVDVADQLARNGIEVFSTSQKVKYAHPLQYSKGAHPLTDPLVQVVSFYVFIEALAQRLGRNPDAPPHLKKVTETI